MTGLPTVVQPPNPVGFGPAHAGPALLTLSLDERGKVVVLTPVSRGSGLGITEIARMQLFAGTGKADWPLLRLDWLWALGLERKALIIIEPRVKQAIQSALDASVVLPLHPLAPEHSLAWIIDRPFLRARRADFNLGLVAGVEYPVEIESVLVHDRRTDVNVKTTTGVVKERTIVRKGRRLQLTIRGAGPKPFIWLEGHDKADMLFDVFEVPEVPTYGQVHAKQAEAAHAAVESVLREYADPRKWRLTKWQHDDVAKAVAVGRMLLAFDPGLGKTVSGLTFALGLVKMGAPDLALFIVPQDLIPQWQREARKRFGREMQQVESDTTVMQEIQDRREGRTLRSPSISARELRGRIRAGTAKGWYIIHYEAISRSGRKEVLNPRAVTNSRGALLLGEKARVLYTKSGYSWLTTAFKSGAIIIDEQSRMMGDETDTSTAIRAMRAKYRLGLTGTPVRNYLVNIFWLLWWCVGNKTTRFPYSYKEGQKAFLRDFATQEKVEGETAVKTVPDPANLLLLRRLLTPSVIRRRVEEIGLPVAVRYITVTAPWGARQREQYMNWLDPERFEEYWRKKFPFTNLKPGEIRRLGAALGQFSHLEYATTCPEGEAESFGHPVGGPTNWTPKLSQALELIRKHVRNGERVLFGSSLVPTVPWVSEQLRAAGFKVECLTEENKKGKHVSLGPVARAEAVQRFVGSGGQVLCASMGAMALGHNLDTVSTVVVCGLPWDFATFEQFLARVRRFSSKRDISVYVVLTSGSLDDKKWELLQRKRAGAASALDIVDSERDESPVSLDEVLADLVARGVADAGPVVDEVGLQKAWEEHTRDGAVVLSTDSEDIDPVRGHGRGMIYYQMHVGAPEVRPPPSVLWQSVSDLSMALSAGYRVPFWSGHQAGLDPRTGLFALIDRYGRVLGMGPAYEVARQIARDFSPRDITLALRLARMAPQDRTMALGWWRQGDWHTELVPADAQWWKKGSWTAEVEVT